ncbi:MAG: DSD1 family PLP-dependent enzyme [SAR202 cluster bacterium]|nr:DSD1 family PLP-dependent enzyme [SAR202 cluster bacterium]
MQRPLSVAPGASVDRLDTPALVVDLDTFERNARRIHAAIEASGIRLRPNAHAHKTPALAWLQLGMKGAAGGVSVVSLGEAETFAASGIGDLLLTMPVVTPGKIARLCALTRHADVVVPVDDAANVDALGRAAEVAGVRLPVAVDIRTDAGEPGAAPDRVMGLARHIDRAPALRFAGLMTSLGPVSAGDSTDAVRDREIGSAATLTSARADCERAGLRVGICSIGDVVASFAALAAMPGLTEIRSASYALADGNHLPRMDGVGWRPAARMLTMVTSRPEPSRAIVDCGQKAISRDLGLPSVDGRPDLTIAGLSAEHGFVDTRDGSPLDLAIGDLLWLVPADAAGAFGLHDIVHGVRGETVEAIWDVAARGRYD